MRIEITGQLKIICYRLIYLRRRNMPERVTNIKPIKQDLTGQETKDYMVWLENFLRSQKTLVLATCHDNIPYCNLMSFALTEESKSLILITPVVTVKYENMSQNRHVSLLIRDDHDPVTFEKGTVVTINGTASEIQGSNRSEAEDLIIAKYPELEDFARSSETAVFRVYFQKAILVRHFQLLTEINF